MTVLHNHRFLFCEVVCWAPCVCLLGYSKTHAEVRTQGPIQWWAAVQTVTRPVQVTACCRTAGLSDCRTAGMPDCRTVGLPDCRTAGLSDSRTAGLSDCRTAGLSDCRTAGQPDCRTVGQPDSRTTVCTASHSTLIIQLS